MKHFKIYYLLLVLVLFTGCYSSKNIEPQYQDTSKLSAEAEILEFPSVRSSDHASLILVHYMPWFQAPPVSDSYGLHWHQGGGNFDPYEVLDNGYANIASHYYPLTGPYDTRDEKILEYQAALFKIAGIDGVIFDWYGIEESLDYPLIYESTNKMIEVLKRAGLKYVMCYEDQSIGKMIEAGAFSKTQAVEYGQNALKWLNDHCFSDDSYIRYDGRPVLMCFGPQYFKDEKEWNAVFSECSIKPYFIGLESHSEDFTDGSYNWFNMNGTKTQRQLVDQLNSFYEKQAQKSFLIATAFPSFHDIYALCGQKSYGFLDYLEGKTFNLSLEAAIQSNPSIIQIATWNDYGEGTMIEPTVQRGYKELEVIQDLKKKYDDNFPYNYLDLRAPLKMYSLITNSSVSETDRATSERTINAIFEDHIKDYRASLKEGGIALDYALRPVIRKPTSIDSFSQPSVFSADGRINKALGAPVVVNNYIYEFTGNKGTDGDLKTYWEGASNAFPNVLTADLIHSYDIDCAVLKLNPQRIWGKRTQEIEVQVSTDGIEYVTSAGVHEYLFDPDENSNSIVISLGTNARYVRIIFSKNSGAAAGQLAELEVYVQENSK